MLEAVPTRSVAETPIKAPALMPPTLSGNRCPRKVKVAAAACHAEDETGAGDMQGDRASRGFGRRNEGCGRETGAR